MVSALNKGAEALRALGHTDAHIAHKLGVSRTLVNSWKLGSRLPQGPARSALRAEFGVPADAWDYPCDPPADPPKVARAPEVAPKDSEDLIRREIGELQKLRDSGDLSPADLRQVSVAIGQLVARLDKAIERSEEREKNFVQSKEWSRFRDAVFDDMRLFPDVYATFTAILVRNGDRSLTVPEAMRPVFEATLERLEAQDP